MVGWKILLTASLFLFCFSCNSVNNESSEETSLQNTAISGSQNQSQEIPDDLVITLERTACYGTCPGYKLTVKANGSVVFEGKQFTETKGKAEGEIDKAKVLQLIKEFKDTGYLKLDGKYDCHQWTDNPSAKTSIQIDGTKKSIDHYHGCRDGDEGFVKELAQLTRLENKIDEIVGSKRWVGEEK